MNTAECPIGRNATGDGDSEEVVEGGLLCFGDLVIWMESEYALLPTRCFFAKDMASLFSASGELNIRPPLY